MKIFTKRSRPVKSNMGLLKETRYFAFGFHIWTENEFVEVADEKQVLAEMRAERHDISEMQDYQHWREKLHLMRLNDEQFDMVLNTRF